MNEDLSYLLAVGAAVKRWMESDLSEPCVRVRVKKKLRAEFCAAMAAPCDRRNVRMAIVPQGVFFLSHFVKHHAGLTRACTSKASN